MNPFIGTANIPDNQYVARWHGHLMLLKATTDEEALTEAEYRFSPNMYSVHKVVYSLKEIKSSV